MTDFDTVIRGGTLATAADVFVADLGVRDGRIAAIGNALGRGAEEIDDGSWKRLSRMSRPSPSTGTVCVRETQTAPRPRESTLSIKRHGCPAVGQDQRLPGHQTDRQQRAAPNKDCK